MSEFVEKFVVTPATGTVNQVVRIPPAFRLWTLLVLVQNNVPTPNPITLDVEYKVADLGRFSRDPPGAPTTLPLNKAFTITSEDSVTEINLKFLYGATVPDEDTVVVLRGTR